MCRLGRFREESCFASALVQFKLKHLYMITYTASFKTKFEPVTYYAITVNTVKHTLNSNLLLSTMLSLHLLTLNVILDHLVPVMLILFFVTIIAMCIVFLVFLPFLVLELYRELYGRE